MSLHYLHLLSCYLFFNPLQPALTSPPTGALTCMITNYLLVTNINTLFSVLCPSNFQQYLTPPLAPWNSLLSLVSTTPALVILPYLSDLSFTAFSMESHLLELGFSPKPSSLSRNIFFAFDHLYPLMILKYIAAAQVSLFHSLPDHSVWMSQTQNIQN